VTISNGGEDQVDIPAPASTAEALAMLRAGMSYLAAADPTTMAAQAQADSLLALEQLDAMETAARAWFLGAFIAGQGCAEDADYSPAAWLIHRTRITRGAARGHLGWARRVLAHPQIVVALAEGTVLTESMARTICGWTDKLPRECRPAADEILVAAARAGARKEDLAGLAAEIYARSLPDPGEDPGPAFEDRQVRVETTFAGAGVITGDLTPECAAVVTAVLESLAAPAGAEDTRTREQRYHDGLQEAMRRLVASGLLPERAGQPVKVSAHISLAELRAMDDGSVLETEWIAEMRIRWAARRAEAADGAGSDGAAWLDGDAARALSCDASITPIVTGEVDPGALDDLVRLCLELAGHGAHCAPSPDAHPAHPVHPDLAGEPGAGAGPVDPAGDHAPASPGDRPVGLAQLTAMSREAIRQAIIGKAAGLLSGPGGLASFLRTRQLGARLAGPSLPLDIGYASTIPPGIRTAVILRDRKCRWPGGCHQPAAACQVHHVKHKAHGGPTSVSECVLLCSFHHQVVIHRWDWTLVLHPDGTTTAWNPDRTKVLHSHGPPARAG
jgi:5-methylcytosine-specific restriction endonuclease McrA